MAHIGIYREGLYRDVYGNGGKPTVMEKANGKWGLRGRVIFMFILAGFGYSLRGLLNGGTDPL